MICKSKLTIFYNKDLAASTAPQQSVSIDQT